MVIRFLLVVIFLGLLSACQPESSDKSDRLVLTGVNIIDVTGSDTIAGATIIIEGERIASITTDGTYKSAPNDRVHELSDYYVMPGLINGHVHFGMADNPDVIYQKILREGVTGIRDLGGPAAPMLEFSAAGDAALGTRPDIYFAGTLAGPEFRQDPRIAPLIVENDGKDPQGIWFVEQDADIEPFVKAAKASGAHGLKLYSSLSAAQLETITRTAETQGMKIWTHAVIFPANATDVISSRPTEIIHTKGLIASDAENLPRIFMAGIRKWMPKQDFALSTLDTPTYQNAFAQMAEANIALNPALIADGDMMMEKRALPPWMMDMRSWACAATGRAHQAGVTITAGTDFGGGPGLLNRELKRLTDCGLSLREALRAATINNAQVLGIHDEVGQVAVGFKANLIVSRQDPTLTFDALENIHLVIKDGVIVEPMISE